MTGKDHDPPADHSHPYEIVENLYISGHPDHSKDFLGKGVQAVVDLEGDIDASVTDAEETDTTLYVYWPVEDGPMPNEHVVRSIASLVANLIANDEKVLVHCKAGHNRSGLICARTLIERGSSAEDAIEQVREKRGDGHALTNENFVEWLRGEKPPES